MTGDVVNLNRYRKRRARQDREAAADANRAKHGRTAGERKRVDDEADRRRRELDAHRIVRDDATGEET